MVDKWEWLTSIDRCLCNASEMGAKRRKPWTNYRLYVATKLTLHGMGTCIDNNKRKFNDLWIGYSLMSLTRSLKVKDNVMTKHLFYFVYSNIFFVTTNIFIIKFDTSFDVRKLPHTFTNKTKILML